MQHNFEAALSLLESQGAVSCDAKAHIIQLCESLKHGNDEASETESCSSDTECSRLAGADSDNTQNAVSRKKTFKPASSKRQQLTDVEAVEIFKLRPKPRKGGAPQRGSMLLCKSLAPKYGVSAKTIRDVWRGRTWLHATEHLWTEEEKKQRTENLRRAAACQQESQCKEAESGCRAQVGQERMGWSGPMAVHGLSSAMNPSPMQCPAANLSFPLFMPCPIFQQNLNSNMVCGGSSWAALRGLAPCSLACPAPTPSWPGCGGGSWASGAGAATVHPAILSLLLSAGRSGGGGMGLLGLPLMRG